MPEENKPSEFGDVDQKSLIDDFFKESSQSLPFDIVNEDGDMVYPKTQDTGTEEPTIENGTPPTETETETFNVSNLQSFFKKKEAPKETDSIQELNKRIDNLNRAPESVPESPEQKTEERFYELGLWMNQQIQDGATPESLKETISRELSNMNRADKEKTKLDLALEKIDRFEAERNFPLAQQNNMFRLLQEHKEWGNEETFTSAIFDRKDGAGDLVEMIISSNNPKFDSNNKTESDIEKASWWRRTCATNPKLLNQLSIHAKAVHFFNNMDKFVEAIEKRGYDKGVKQQQQPTASSNGSFVS